ncbi:peptidoglycan editing factor PgeF [Cognatiluteimonas profundi]|uniref:peptidoglycan editing factor PgeF n=1 Tax=Cognatiluteimonas profundi TaxID=2594501 RepID=UPI00131BA365|nr:peptidoglycan editing factor PgeF [Lysobacter profundi]
MNDTAVLQAELGGIAGVAALTTLRHGAGVSQAPFDDFNLGTRCGDAPDAVARNRDELAARFALPGVPRWLRQVHGNRVAVEPAGDEPEADAAISRTRGLVLAILTADCLPVVLAARDGGEVALAHAGWRGLAGGVLEATIAAMWSSPRDIVAWMGPAAGPRAYEVGEDVYDAFAAGEPRAASAFVATRPGHWLVDLPALARRRLLAAGLQHVHGGDLCTISDPARFFSHRRDRVTGRMATLAWLK